MKNEFNFSPFYLSFLALCERDGISPTKAAKDAGISSGAPTAWKTKGSIPRPDQREKLCALFNVTENELLGYGGQKEKPPAQGGELIGPNKQALLSLVEQMSDDEAGPVLEIVQASLKMREKK